MPFSLLWHAISALASTEMLLRLGQTGFLYGQSVGATLEQSARIGSLLAGYIIDVIGAQIPDDKWEQIKLKVKGILA